MNLRARVLSGAGGAVRAAVAPPLALSWPAILRLSVVPGVLLLATAPTPTYAATVYVDADASPGGNGSSWMEAYRDLQNALADAHAGGVDEIWIAEGTYRPSNTDRDASFDLVADLVLYGGFAGTESSAEERDPIAHETILSGDLHGDDGQGFLNTSDNSRHVVTGTDPVGTVVDGIIVEGGNADFDGSLLLGGGGMFFISSGALGQPAEVTVRDCRFRANSAGLTFSELGNFGGAILLRGTGGVIERCEFTGNRANNGGAIGVFDRNAASMSVDVTLEIADCTFTANFSPSASGGAMWTAAGRSAVGTQTGRITVLRCLFDSNDAEYWGAWIDQNGTFLRVEDCTFMNCSSRVVGGAFGHIQTAGTDVDPALLRRCDFLDNEAQDEGGGVWLAAADAVILDCRFIGNHANVAGGVRSGTYFTELGAQDLTLVNCLFDGNTAQNSAAVWSADTPILRVTNCTIVDNGATSFPTGGISTRADAVDVDNTIFYGNTGSAGATEAAQLRHEFGAPMSVDFSLIQGLTGALGGTGNIDADPLFADAERRLADGSPCIDAGNNTALADSIQFDLGGAPRLVDDPATPDTGLGTPPIVDMGAHEFPAVATGVAEDEGRGVGGETPAEPAWGAALFIEPNPFRGAATISFTAPGTGPVRLEIYDIAGRRVRTLVEAGSAGARPVEAGAYRVTWDGRDAGGREAGAGVYFARLSTVTGDHAAKIVVRR